MYTHKHKNGIHNICHKFLDNTFLHKQTCIHMNAYTLTHTHICTYAINSWITRFYTNKHVYIWMLMHKRLRTNEIINRCYNCVLDKTFLHTHKHVCNRAYTQKQTLNWMEYTYLIWAVACDFQQCGILTSVDSDEHVQPPFKLRTSKRCLVSSLKLIEYSSDKQWLWSDCAYAQADLRLFWSHIPHCWKSHALAHICYRFLYNTFYK